MESITLIDGSIKRLIRFGVIVFRKCEIRGITPHSKDEC